MFRRLVSFLGLTLLIIGCSSTNPKTRNLVPITIVHTNDQHGHAWAYPKRNGQVVGGYPAQAKMINDIRAEVREKNGVLLILSGGDINTGVPESDLQFGRPDVEAMNTIGYHAMVIGNHEFDRGQKNLLRQMTWTNFPVLSSNILFKTTRRHFAKPYSVQEIDGLKVGIIGLTTPDLKSLVMEKHTKNLDILNPIQTAKDMLPMMKREGAEFIVGLSHVGVVPPESNEIGDRTIAREVPGIHVVVGGHSHTLLPDGIKEGNTLIVQSGHNGNFLGRADLVYDRAQDKVISSSAIVLPVKPSGGVDQEVEQLMASYWKKGDKELGAVIGEALVYLNGDRHDIRRGETNLGNLICDIIKEETKSDIAVYNSGGIRSGVTKGPIQLRDIYRLLPFGNMVVTAKISGRQLKQALESGIKYRKLTGSLLQVSGITYRAHGNKLVDARVNGRKINDRKLYKFATAQFLLSGGDKFTMMKKTLEQTDTGVPVARMVSEYIKRKRHIHPKVEGRIKWVSGNAD